MASTISYLTISCSRASLFRHWALVITLCSLLFANNFLIFTANAMPSLTLHTLPLSQAPKINHSISDEVQLTPLTNFSFRSNPLVRISLKNLPSINETKGLLTISSPKDSAFENFVIEVSNPPRIVHESIVKTTLYSFVGVTITNLCAVVGFICIPVQRYRHFSLVLSFMISLAVSALLSTAVLVLVPESMRMVDMPLEFGGQGRAYLFKFACVPAGVLFFFIIEYVLLIMPRLSKWNVSSEKIESLSDANNEDSKNWGENSDFPNQDFPNPEVSAGDIQVLEDDDSHSAYSVYVSQKSLAFPRRRLCFRFDREKYSKVAPVAWMILFGDAFHNFMDGMTIAVGFTESPSIGIALTLSILFEELPSELGDFAILISSGFSVKAAVCANFLSACCSYLGLVLGVIIGEVSAGALYVFAITSGFFLYISLSDMLPKLREALEELENKKENSLPLFILQLTGMLIGFGFVLAVTLISDYIVV